MIRNAQSGRPAFSTEHFLIPGRYFSHAGIYFEPALAGGATFTGADFCGAGADFVGAGADFVGAGADRCTGAGDGGAERCGGTYFGTGCDGGGSYLRGGS